MAPPQVTIDARYPGRDRRGDREQRRRADRDPAERHRQPAVLLLDQLLERQRADRGRVQAGQQPGHQPGQRAEQAEPGDASAAAGGDAAGAGGRQEVAEHHDGGVGLLARRALRRRLHRQLHQPVRARRAEARPGREPLLGVRLARHRDAGVAAARPHGPARHHGAGGRGRDPEPEPGLRHRPARRAARPARRRAAIRGHRAGPAHQAGGVREHHRAHRQGRRGDRAHPRHRPRRARQARLLDVEPDERQDRHHHRRLPAARRERGGHRPRRCASAWRS